MTKPTKRSLKQNPKSTETTKMYLFTPPNTERSKSERLVLFVHKPVQNFRFVKNFVYGLASCKH